MNEKTKRIFMYIGASIIGIFSFIFGAVLQGKRNSIDENRARAKELKRESNEQQSANRRAIKEARERQSKNKAAISGIDGALETITEIRKKQKHVSESDNLSNSDCS